MHLLISLSIVCSYYIPALLCLFCPTLVMESGIRHIVLEGASPLSIRALIGNNVFFKDCSTVASKMVSKGKNVYRPPPVHGIFNSSYRTWNYCF